MTVENRAASQERNEAERILSEVEGWLHITIPKSKIEPAVQHYEILKWCEDRLGPGRVEPSQYRWLDGNDVWYSFTWYGYYNFYFKHKNHATMFVLKWGK